MNLKQLELINDRGSYVLPDSAMTRRAKFNSYPNRLTAHIHNRMKQPSEEKLGRRIDNIRI